MVKINVIAKYQQSIPSMIGSGEISLMFSINTIIKIQSK